METQRVYQASVADWQNSLRIANRVGRGAIAAGEGLPKAADVAIKVAFLVGVLAFLLGTLA